MNSDKNSPFLSIIIPVYNVEQYLKRCFDSILSQSFQNWEMIVVNDCSPDNSQKIIESYSKKDKRIKSIINARNKGLGGARNIGLNFCLGEYVLFIDSDDFVSNGQIIEEICKKASSNNLDVLDTRYNVLQTGEEVQILPKKFIEINRNVCTGLSYLSKVEILPIVAWNKLYKRAFIIENNILFKERKYEDICFTLEVLYKAKRVQNSNLAFYNYVIRPGSIMTSEPNKTSIIDALQLCKDLETMYLGYKKNPQIEKSFFYSFVSLSGLLNEFEDKKYKKEISIEFNKIYKKYRFSILKASKLGFKQKILLFLSPRLMNYVISKIKN